MIKQKLQPGDPLQARDWNELLTRVRSSQVRGGRGVSLGRTQGGVVVQSDQHRRDAAFVVEIPDDGSGEIVAKVAIWDEQSGRWSVEQGDQSRGRYRPWPGVSLSLFEDFVLDDQDVVTDEDRSCEVDGDFLLPPGTTPAAVGLQGFFAKVAEVNHPEQICLVVPTLIDLDPTDKVAWHSQGEPHFDYDAAVCCWIGGWTGVRANTPVHVIKYPNLVLPVIAPLYNLTGEEAARYCRPAGPFTPEGNHNCPPPPEDAEECLEAACCKPDGTCSMLKPPICEQMGGFVFEGMTCDDPFVQDHCEEWWACCLGPDDCRMMLAYECDQEGGTFHSGIDCSADPCAPPPPVLIPCCFPVPGTCDIFNTGPCQMVTEQECIDAWTAECNDGGSTGQGVVAAVGGCPDCGSTNCSNLSCVAPDPDGVCCGPLGCTGLDEAACGAFGGTWIPGGDCTSC